MSFQRIQTAGHCRGGRVFFPVVLCIGLLAVTGSVWAAPAANLDQLRNDGCIKKGVPSCPTTPSGGDVQWHNGNLGAQQAHLMEGWSVPYRVILTDLGGRIGDEIYLEIGFDGVHGGKQALDYITHYNRLNPNHLAAFGHATEVIDPLEDVAGLNAVTDRDTLDIGPPTWSVVVNCAEPFVGDGESQPTQSFSDLESSEGNQIIEIWGAEFVGGSFEYTQAVDPATTDAESKGIFKVRFTIEKATVVMAWGGHIADFLDWGCPEELKSASALPGSPYHMRLIDWGPDLPTLGNTDRSLAAAAVFIPPCEITCPPDQTITCACDPVPVFFDPPTVTGGILIGCDWTSGDVFPIGTTTVTCTGQNPRGEECECTFDVTVEEDTEPPVIGGVPDDVTGQCDDEIPDAATDVTCTDNCTDITPVFSETDVGTCPRTITRTWTCTDTCGNSVSDSQTIVIDDTIPPVMTCPTVDPVCEPNQPVFTPPTATDNCDPDPVVVCTRSDGETDLDADFPVGTTTITCTATDDCLNETTCTTDVVVNPNPACTMDAFDPLNPEPLTGDVSTPTTGPYTCVATVTGTGWSVDTCSVGGTGGTEIEVTYTVTQPASISALFIVTVTDANGCFSDCEADVTINVGCTFDPIPDVCEGDSLNVCVAPTSGSPLFEVEVYGPFASADSCSDVATLRGSGMLIDSFRDVDIDEENCVSGDTSAAGVFTYCAIDTDALGFEAICSQESTVNPNPDCLITRNPDVGRTCVGFETELCAPAGMAEYLWTGPDEDGSTDQCITVDVAGTYRVDIVDENGCENDCSITLEECVPCRFTGGGNDGILPPKAWADGQGGTPNAETWTCGGQVGAPTTEEPGPFGEWTHREHGRSDGVTKFTFHGGTNSAPPPPLTEITWVQCFDECNCQPARPAPAKQLDFAGFGAVKNGEVGGYGKGTVSMPFYVQIEDLGEPGNQNEAWPATQCPFMGHPDGDDADCDCADFYHIRIWAPGDDMFADDPIYEAFGYLHGGNFQIHPAVGETFDGSGCP